MFLSLIVPSTSEAQSKTPEDTQTEQQLKAVGKLLEQGKPAEAERLLDQTRLRSNDIKSQLGDLSISTYAFTSTLLISRYLNINDYPSAERIATDRVKWAEQRYGPAAFQVGGMLSLLANINRLQGKYKEAEPLYTRSLSIYRSFHQDDCLLAKDIFTGLAETSLALQRPRDAEDLLRPAIEACRQKFGQKGIYLCELLNVYAVALEQDNQPQEAAKASAEADRTAFIDPQVIREERDLLKGRLLAAQGRVDESVLPCRKWIATFDVPDEKEPDRRLMLPLGECERLLRSSGRKQEADDVAVRLKAIITKYNVHF